MKARHRWMALRHSGELLQSHFGRLRELPAHGNTVLHADVLVKALLLSFFDPMVRSLRLIESRGNFDGQIDLPRLARSTTSDALAVFDPHHLLPVIEDLRERCPQLHQLDEDLPGITQRIIAADGTYLTTLADLAWSLQHTKQDGRRQGQVRANVQLEAGSWIPQVVSLSGDDEESEPSAFARDLLEGVLYVVDRNFVSFSFIASVLEKQSDFVMRMKSTAPRVEVLKSESLAAEDRQAGVIADQQVVLVGSGAPAGIFRQVTIVTTDRNGNAQTIKLLTNLTGSTTVAARVIGAVYRLRWQIELFFKWLKCFAGMDHLLSTSRKGITTQLYVAVIAVLMMYVQTGRRVSIYSLAALSHLASGKITLQQAMEFLARRERERELAKARQARRREKKRA